MSAYTQMHLDDSRGLLTRIYVADPNSVSAPLGSSVPLSDGPIAQRF